MKLFLVIVGVLALLAIAQANALPIEGDNPEIPNEEPSHPKHHSRPHHGPASGHHEEPKPEPNPESEQPNEENPDRQHVLLISGSTFGDGNTIIELNPAPSNNCETSTCDYQY